MKFVIIGAGSVGLNIAEKLNKHNDDVILIDRDIERIERAKNEFGFNVIKGDGCDPKNQLQAGIKTADYLIAVTNSDGINLACCEIAKMIAPEVKRIGRIRNLDLENEELPAEEVRELFDLIINPPKVTAEYLADIIRLPGSNDYMKFADGRLVLLAIKVEADFPVVNKKLSSLAHIREQTPLLLASIVRGEKIIVPRGSDRILEGDTIYVLSHPEHIQEILLFLNSKKYPEVKNVMISGNTLLSRHLIHALEKQNKNIKLITDDQEFIEYILQHADTTLIIKGNSTDSKILTEENISDVDVFIAADKSEDHNIMSSILAKKLGAKSTIAHVESTELIKLVNSLGIDFVINTQLAAALNITRTIYANTLLSATTITHLQAHIIEVELDDQHAFANQAIKDISLPYGILVAAVIRGEEAIIPHGTEVLLPGDRILIYFINSSTGKLEKLLKTKLTLLQ